MIGQETIDELYEELGRADQLAVRLRDLALEAPTLNSQLSADNFATAPLAYRDYVSERSQNAAQIASEIHTSTVVRKPGKLYLNFPTLYPLLRAVLEDCACIIWLLTPPDQSTRLPRFIRVLWADQNYFTVNHILLGEAAKGHPQVLEDQPARLVEHMENEGKAAAALFGSVASRLGIADSQWKPPVSNKALLEGAHGAGSIPYVLWKMLSDLSHYSYLMSRHLALGQNADGTLLREITLQFVQQMNRSLEAATDAFKAASSDPRPT